MACPNNVHVFEQDRHILDRSKCTACGACTSVCLTGALKMAGKSMTAPEVLAEVMKDKPFYDQSVGGMTLTGGEPLFQASFAFELLKEARKEGVHTCVETSGHAATRTFSRAMPLTNIFLYDLKIQDSTLHEKYTGVNNTLILKNLHFLNQHGASVHLRCPVIPGVNDNNQHFRWLAGTLQAMKHVESLELIPYHTYGLSKYARFGLTQRLPGSLEKPGADTLQEWQAAFNSSLQKMAIPFISNEKPLLWKRK
jgi:pyruvate formate lyase activating enzyme